jgi:hypothetical protein
MLEPPTLQRPGTKLLPALHLLPAGKHQAVEPACITATGHLFITDMSTKQLFPMDTGLDLCVFHLKLITAQGAYKLRPLFD